MNHLRTDRIWYLHSPESVDVTANIPRSSLPLQQAVLSQIPLIYINSKTESQKGFSGESTGGPQQVN